MKLKSKKGVSVFSSYIKYVSMIGLSGLVLSGCAGGQPSIPKVDEAEVGKYEKAYMDEFNKIQIQYADYKPTTKWIQPKNKKESCKVFFVVDPNNDITTRPDYEFYWDGECKDGYAFGLGREIEITMLQNKQQIGFYQNGKAIDYCVIIDELNGATNDGECSYSSGKANHYVLTRIDDKNGDLEISYEFGKSATLNSPSLLMRTYPFYDVVEYFKAYPNYSYLITDLTENEFDNRKYEFIIREHKNGKSNGFGFTSFKNGHTVGGEMVNGSLLRRVQLPQSYFQKADTIFNEIKNTANIALDAQRKALAVKEKYKNKICKDDVKVDFMDNDEYKSICKEDENIALLKTRIDTKLAQIEQQKQAKRQQQNEQRLIQAREAEAMAAQRRAAAAEQANNQAAWDSVNRSIQNMNSNMQMQQLNNNLMMYNFMPKRYDVYLH